LVATLTPSGTDTPVRFVATLAPGQSVTLSTARMLGESAVQVRFIRQGDQVIVAGAKSPEVATHWSSSQPVGANDKITNGRRRHIGGPGMIAVEAFLTLMADIHRRLDLIEKCEREQTELLAKRLQQGKSP
jgi:hypothetical protein